MGIMFNIVLIVQVLAALAMIGLILVQHGKGADMGAAFGSGASGSLFGATGSANFLSRTTAVLATVFFVCTLVLAMLTNGGRQVSSGGTSVLETAAPAVAASAPAAPATPAAPASANTSGLTTTLPATPASGVGQIPGK